jgi:hypothetical protein
MPDLVFIGDLANAGALDGTERVPMDKSAATVDASTQEIANLATKATVGLANVDNTSDANKPISTATQTALGLKANSSGTLAQFAATTSTQLLGVISDETGTGSLVFATSPTLVTPALGTPASGTLTNCTGLPFDAGVSNKPTTLSGYGITDGFTQANVRATPITGFTSGAGAVAATDTILQALQKLNGNIAASSGLPASLTADGSNNLTLTARWTQSTNGAASAPPHALTGTWFTGGTTQTTKPQFLIEPAGTTSNNWSVSGTGFGVNAASGFTGNLLDLQVNGINKASFSATGALNIGGMVFGSSDQIIGNGNAGRISISSSDAAILFGTAVNAKRVGYVGNAAGFVEGFSLANDLPLRWSSTSSATQSPDILLHRDAAGTLAQRNGANAQTSRIYNTYTSDTNFERAKIEWASNILRIGTEKGSAGGTARDMELQTDGTTRITVKASGAIIFSGIPTSNPNVAGQLWNDGGTLKISA